MPASPKSTKSAISKAALGVVMMTVQGLLPSDTGRYWSLNTGLRENEKTSTRPPYECDDKAQLVVAG
jgi:hypothetical protein